MAQITRKGKELESKLLRSFGTTTKIAEACSLICRHATTHHRLQEMYCNGHPIQGRYGVPIETVNRVQAKFDAWLDKRESQIERRIIELVESLPETDNGPIVVDFTGDPRGVTVTLLMPDGNVDNWGNDGLCVPQR